MFIPIRDRRYESEISVFGQGGEGVSEGGDEFVVEIVVRGGWEGRRRAVERVLEGWCSTRGGACELNMLDSLKNIFLKGKAVEEVINNSFHSVFNADCVKGYTRPHAKCDIQPEPYAITTRVSGAGTATICTRRYFLAC